MQVSDNRAFVTSTDHMSDRSHKRQQHQISPHLNNMLESVRQHLHVIVPTTHNKFQAHGGRINNEERESRYFQFQHNQGQHYNSQRQHVG